MKETKRSFLTSCVSLILCFVMLLGTTFAWFTDEVTSANNVIQAGELDIELHWSKDNVLWHNAETNNNPIFNYDKWEPGYTEVRYLKVRNEGNLSFKYQMSINPVGLVGTLAEVIDVNYDIVTGNDNFTAPTKDNKQGSLKKVGTLDDLLDANGIVAGGVLLPKGETKEGYYTEEIIICVSFHMDEYAGNEYQNLSIGDGFGIKLVATQFDYENDSFDNSYDDKAEWPELPVENSASAKVTTDTNGILTESVTMTSADGKISATLPAGTKMEQGVTTATLNVAELDESEANFTLGDNESTRSIDVHISGVAEDNEAVMAISIKELLPKALNMGNYRFYHVEDGNTVLMTLLENGNTPVHNNYKYDPATGDVVLYLNSFSEVAVAAEDDKAWKGEFDYDWYNTTDTYFEIANADQLAAFGAIVGGMVGQTQDSFDDKTVKLISDINLGDDEENNVEGKIFYPIGYWNSDGTYEKSNKAISSGFYAFEGTFDGNGNTISNFYQNTWEMKGDHDWYDANLQYFRDGMGLFGKVYGGTVKNLTVSDFSSDGEITTTGTIAAYAEGATFENIAIFNCNPRVYNIGNGGIVGCVGWYAKEAGLKTTFKNITVDNSNKISALWGSYDVSCGGILGQYYPTSGQTSAGKPANAGIHFENCHVAAVIDVNNDVCANYQYYWYRYSGMFIGNIRATTKDANGYTIADTTGVTAENCTYTLGDWNEYWYCELVKNTLASYTHDHQFSRLTKISSISEIKDENGNWNKEGNFVIPAADNSSATCYHIFKNSEGQLYEHKHDSADESNDYSPYESFDLNGDGKLNDLKEDRTCYFMPFNQLFNGNGYGVKAHYTFDGMTEVVDGPVESGTKFESLGTVTTYRPGQTITLGQLVEYIVDDSKLSKTSIFAAVSPATESDTVSATYSLDLSDWKNSTITFAEDSTGSAKIVITDYFYCTPTVIYLNPEQAAEKFTANSVSAQNAYTQITLGTLFGVKDGVTIGNVTATVTDPNGKAITVTGTSSDWATKTIDLTKDGTWTVAIKDDDAYCSVTTVTFTVNKVDKFSNKFDKDFLYRVGNENTVDIGNIFGEIQTAVALSSVNVTIENVEGNAAGTFTSNATWTNGTIQFTGTGVVKVTITADAANAKSIYLEVVDATNVTTYSELKNQNSVFLNDITMSSDSSYYLSGATLYGNGFTFDVTNGAYSGTGQVSSNYVICIAGSVLDNISIIGAVYTEYGAETSNDYNRPVVLSVGNNNIIKNCYISNCAAPVRIRDGNLEIINSTLKGGNFANIDIRGGNVVLDNITTINQVNSNDTAADGSIVVGLGVVIYYENVLNTTTVEIKNGITQYNYLSKLQTETYIQDDTAKKLTAVMFNNSYSSVQYNEGTDIWVNTGILSMTETVGKDNITDVDGYVDASPTMTGVTGYLHTKKPDSASITATAPEYVTVGQGAIAPSYEFDFTDKNYVGKTDGSNDYCYNENGTVVISMDKGDIFNWDTSILTATKNGSILNYKVTMSGVDYTNKTIPFDTAGDYIVVYTYIDEYNYKLNSGNIISYDISYQKIVTIKVSVIEDTTVYAEFTFTNGGTTEKKNAGNKTYISASGVTVDNTKWSSITVDGETIIYPIVTATVTGQYNKNAKAYFYVFDGVVTIKDGDNTYNSSTTTKPDGLTVVKGWYGTASSVSSTWTNITESNLTQSGPSNVFKYGASSSAGADPTTYDGKLCYASPGSLNRSEVYYTLVQYSYKDAAKTYYYYVGYVLNNPSGCVTPDTLVTLADGSQKEIQHVTYEDQLLVWNFYTGRYDVVPSSIVMNHGYDNYTVTALRFSDGTEVKTINGHGFFDVATNKYVILSDANAADYIGHEFVKVDGDGYTTVKLESYEVYEEYTESWSILTAGHYNCILEGMWTVTPAEVEGSPDYLMPFDVNDAMKYDEAAMQADIEKYGLYTYEDFSEYCTYEQFVGFGFENWKVAVGKGYITWDDILYLISIHIG